MDIAKLNDLINKAEENMVQLRKRYEGGVQERNDMWVIRLWRTLFISHGSDFRISLIKWTEHETQITQGKLFFIL